MAPVVIVKQWTKMRECFSRIELLNRLDRDHSDIRAPVAECLHQPQNCCVSANFSQRPGHFVVYFLVV